MISFNEKEIERIAREYCRLTDDDPDKEWRAIGEAGIVMKPRWQIVADHVRERFTMDAAIWEMQTHEQSTKVRE